MKALALCAALALSGCASLPEPGAQLRITEGAGEAGYPLIGGAEGRGCIVSVVGDLPPALSVSYRGERCGVVYRDANQGE